jgi:hypothetical protein
MSLAMLAWAGQHVHLILNRLSSVWLFGFLALISNSGWRPVHAVDPAAEIPLALAQVSLKDVNRRFSSAARF